MTYIMAGWLLSVDDMNDGFAPRISRDVRLQSERMRESSPAEHFICLGCRCRLCFEFTDRECISVYLFSTLTLFSSATWEIEKFQTLMIRICDVSCKNELLETIYCEIFLTISISLVFFPYTFSACVMEMLNIKILWYYLSSYYISLIFSAVFSQNTSGMYGVISLLCLVCCSLFSSARGEKIFYLVW